MPGSEEKRTVMHLAELIGVSYMTISRAINRPHLVKEETRRLIEEGMRKHQIFPNASARNLRRSRKKTIGFVMPDGPNVFYLELFQTFMREARKRDCELLLHPYDPSVTSGSETFDTPFALDGVIIQASAGEESLLEAMTRMPYPLVIAGNVEYPNRHVVAADDRGNAVRLARALLGVRKLRTVTIFALPPFNHSVEERIAGFSEGLAAADGPKITVRRFVDLAELQSSVRTLPPPDAIMAINDFTAMKTILSLSRRGIQAPEDVLVSGYDNVSLIRDAGLRFPTVDMQLPKQAKLIFDLLEANMAGKQGKPKRKMVEGQIILE